jgi:hypothetical protein
MKAYGNVSTGSIFGELLPVTNGQENNIFVIISIGNNFI